MLIFCGNCDYHQDAIAKNPEFIYKAVDTFEMLAPILNEIINKLSALKAKDLPKRSRTRFTIF